MARRELPSALVLSSVIALTYAMVLMWHVNYPIYRDYGIPGFVLQGRYMFPVLGPLVGIFSSSILRISPRPLQPLVALAVATVFLLGDLPTFLEGADDCWYFGTEHLARCQLS